jgi:hypothetical protein
VTGKCQQGVRDREIPTNIMAIQWSFPDTARFQRNILTCPFDDVNVSMEEYAELVLTMFYSYRSHANFVPNGPGGNFPFVQKFREIYQNEASAAIAGQLKRVFTDCNIKFLQNVQNCAYNSRRYKVENDDLQSLTASFVLMIAGMIQTMATTVNLTMKTMPSMEFFLIIVIPTTRMTMIPPRYHNTWKISI